ncbi:MAG: hypothetical protein K9H49_20310 [Bacteroidales bacterium]|nr:hypothetical protein [Saprospiraceae bacterium]MCF8381923.1 hypothetical protein [Bacteroidales bacterium]
MKLTQSTFNKIHFSWIVFLFFALVYACSLTFYYAEGDDAATALYHVIGRIPEIQKPYEPYHSGFDFILSFLPANEATIRAAMIGITAMAQPALIIGLFYLVFSWLSIGKKSLLASCIVFLTLLSIPELFFMGLYYNPTTVSLAFLTLSHLLLRKSFNQTKQWNYLYLISIILFAFGATIRWNMAIYGLVIFLDFIFNEKYSLNKLIRYLVWSFFALFFFFFFLWLEGIRLADIQYILSFKETNLDVLVRPLSEKIRQNISFFTPSLIFLLFIGIVYKFKEGYKFIIYASIGFFINYIYFDSLFFKVIAPFFVFIFYFMTKGLMALIDFKWISRKYSILIMFVAALLPWIVGIQIQNSRVWGPGFELKEKYFQLEIDKNIEKASVKKYNWNFALFDGVGFAHPEGPRPMYGYGGILLGGKWRALVNQDRREYKQMVYTAINTGYPFLKIGFNNNIENILYSEGYKTNQKEKDVIYPNIHSRVFYNQTHDSIVILHVDKLSFLFDSILLNEIISEAPKSMAIPYGEYYGKPILLANLFK